MEAVAGSTLSVLPSRPAKDTNNSILLMAKGGMANSGMATVSLVKTMGAPDALTMEEAGAVGVTRDY